MYLTSALALLFYGSALLTLPISGAATTDGFTIPANITEGHLYAVTIDPTTGEELHTRLDSLLPGPEPEPLARRHHEKRGANAAAAAAGRRDHPPRAYTFCGDGYVQASDLLDNAIHTFTDRCDRSNAVFLKDTLAVYAAHGTAVAYMCNFSTHGNPCRSMELLDALSLIGARCKWSQGGVLQSGVVLLKGWKKAYGYTHNLDKSPICGSHEGRWGRGIKGWKDGIRAHEGVRSEDK